jgi:hypothetical protein
MQTAKYRTATHPKFEYNSGLKIWVGHRHCPTDDIREIVKRREETTRHSVRPK